MLVTVWKFPMSWHQWGGNTHISVNGAVTIRYWMAVLAGVEFMCQCTFTKVLEHLTCNWCFLNLRQLVWSNGWIAQCSWLGCQSLQKPVEDSTQQCSQTSLLPQFPVLWLLGSTRAWNGDQDKQQARRYLCSHVITWCYQEIYLGLWWHWYCS